MQSGIEPASKRRSGDASSSGEIVSKAPIEQLRSSHVAFCDPDEPKPFSKLLLGHCHAKGLCLFCVEGKHRMFDLSSRKTLSV